MKNKHEGFTLIEIVLVLAMISIIMAGIVGALMGTFRAQTKMGLSNKVVQNGNWALSEIRKNVLNGVGIDMNCPISPSIGSSMSFTNIGDGQVTVIKCYPPDATYPHGRIASESANNGVFDLISTEEVNIKDCLNFVSCESDSSPNVVSSVNFNFILSAGNTDSSSVNYTEKSFKSKVTIRN